MSRHKLGLRDLAAFMVALALAGCGATAAGRKAPRPNTRQAAQHALKLWSRFAAATSPRPVVLLDGPVLDPNIGALSRYDPHLRRVLHPEALLAFNASRFALRTKLPHRPSRFRGWRVISGRQAFTLLLHSPAVKLKGQPPSRMRLAITRVRLASGAFSTDRGQRTLPVWAFTVHGLERPVRVLALPGSGVFLPPVNWAGENATVSGNGRLVRVAFVGGHAGDKPCDDSYTAGSIADSHAVAFWITDHPAKRTGNVACDAVGYPRVVDFRLAKPLGARALVESFGAPVPVCRGKGTPPVGMTEICLPGAN
jgi:hypothetical protein